jgi:nitroimidazol reductase NimA-like FMN-containing flavoprotein (pyridoxamine 5'-phosphate oxidase superfamily)
MSTHVEPITVLDDDESWYLLASMTLGRLVTNVAGQPEIFPVNFVVQRPTILFRTAEGTKLLSAVIDDRVAFEADEHSVEEGWSVVVKAGRTCCRPARISKAPNGLSFCPGFPTSNRATCG